MDLTMYGVYAAFSAAKETYRAQWAVGHRVCVPMIMNIFNLDTPPTEYYAVNPNEVAVEQCTAEIILFEKSLRMCIFEHYPAFTENIQRLF